MQTWAREYLNYHEEENPLDLPLRCVARTKYNYFGRDTSFRQCKNAAVPETDPPICAQHGLSKKPLVLWENPVKYVLKRGIPEWKHNQNRRRN